MHVISFSLRWRHILLFWYSVMQDINSIYHDLGYVHTIADSLSFRQEKPQNLSQNWYKSSTHIEHCAGAVAREDLVLEIHPNPHTWIFDFRGSGFSPFCLLIHFYFGPNTCSYCTKVWYRTYPIYVMLHSRDLHGATSVCYRNRAEVTRSPSYAMLFSCRRKKYPV